MVYDTLYSEARECWSCGVKTRNAIIAHEGKDLPLCEKCMILLWWDVKALLESNPSNLEFIGGEQE